MTNTPLSIHSIHRAPPISLASSAKPRVSFSGSAIELKAMGPRGERDIVSQDGDGADETFRAGLLSLIPFLRAFSRTLCRERDIAEDLAQETLCKAWEGRLSFERGSNLKAWLFMILRNQFYSNHRRAWRQKEWDENAACLITAPSDQQVWAAELSEIVGALGYLPPKQREALVLFGVGGFSHEDIAAIHDCAVGTAKSRVARTRKAILAILERPHSLPGRARPAIGCAVREITTQLDHLMARRMKKKSVA